MVGSLPKALDVNGAALPIDSDFRNILAILLAFADPELEDKEKAYICLNRMFTNPGDIGKQNIQAAYEAAVAFIEYGITSDDKEHRSRHKLMDWERDEAIIFPAINKAAGTEVREVPYMHWWTFLGYFQSIDPQSLMGTVLSIRQKKMKGKKLEKWEREFERNNRELCALDYAKLSQTPEQSAINIFNELLGEGGD